MTFSGPPEDFAETPPALDGEPSFSEPGTRVTLTGPRANQTIMRLVYSIGGTGLMQVSNVLSGIALARALGPEHRGQLSQIIAWYSFISSVLMFGINDSLVYYKSRGDSAASVLSTAFTGCIITAVLSVASCLMAYFLHLAELPPSARVAALVFLFFPPIYQFSQVVMSYFQVSEKPRLWTLLRLSQGPVYVMLIITAVALRRSTVLSMVMANLASASTPLLIGLVAIAIERPRLRVPPFGEMRRFFAYGSLLITQKISIVSKDNLDRMILPFFISATLFGNYVVAATCAFLIGLIGPSIDLVAFPTVARQSDPVLKRRMAELFVSGTIFLTALGLIILIPLAPWLVTLLFGDAYRSAAPLVAYFLVAGALQAVRNVLGGMFKAFARGGSLAWIETVNSVLMLLVIVGLARREGALAGALAHLISAAVSISLALYLAARNLGLSPVRMISPAAAFKEGHALWRRTVLRRSA